MAKGNMIVGQSGGPTSVINSSLAGVYRTAKDLGANKVYGMLNGIKGLLEGRYTDLSKYLKNSFDIELLKRTPSAFLGSCRFKLKSYKDDEQTYKRIFKQLEELDIEYFLYIGGNDSMDTIQNLYEYGKAINSPIRFVGVPKTIDNDLAVTDHSPGYGSAAKYVATAIKELEQDGMVYGKQITIAEVMGRNAGWLTAAAALARSENCDGADMILLPELAFDPDAFVDRVGELLSQKSTIVIAVSEGIKLADGRYVSEVSSSKALDAFGHASLGGTASQLSELIGDKYGLKTRPVEFSALQRCASHCASATDVNEAFQVGGQAVKAAMEGQTGKAAIYIRTSDTPYQCATGITDASNIANVERKVPKEWITQNGTYVSQQFINYMRPLIQGEIAPVYKDGLPLHLTLKDA